MISDFLKTLGGPHRVAALLSEQTGENVSRPRVAMWGVKNYVPYRWRMPLYRLAQDCGQPIPPEVSEGVVLERST